MSKEEGEEGKESQDNLLQPPLNSCDRQETVSLIQVCSMLCMVMKKGFSQPKEIDVVSQWKDASK